MDAMSAARNPNSRADALLDTTLQRPVPARPPKPPSIKPIGYAIRQWAASPVAMYRVSFTFGYLGMMYFGASAFVAGIPTFAFTTPQGWTPIWSSAVVAGGLIAGIGSVRAGAEPITKMVHAFNRIELAGAVLLFLTLGTYATVLLIIGYGFGDAGRSSIGAGFVALGIPSTIRMLWLILRPRFLASGIPAPRVLVPDGYQLVKIETGAHTAKDAYETDAPPTGLEGA